MAVFRYGAEGNWYKGNTHIHSVASDGGCTFSQLAERYAGAGYDFLFRTDHWVCSTVAEDDMPYPLLWIDGVELDGRDGTGAAYHVVCLGTVSGLAREQGLTAALDAARQQGALTIVAHPRWCGNDFSDCLRITTEGVEIYNHVCHWLNGKSDGLAYWDAMLDADPEVLGFAVDDSHLRPGHPTWNGGWVVVQASDCTADTILAAIRAGRFYSSCGPAFQSITHSDDDVTVTTSPVRCIRLVGPASRGLRWAADGTESLTSCTLQVPPEWAWAYIEIEDGNGKRAWTNTLFAAGRYSSPGASSSQVMGKRARTVTS